MNVSSTSASSPTTEVDVLIVGAGPTGLALAAQLDRFGTSFRIVDRQFDRVRESRALGIQARTLELLQSVGLGDPLAEAGRAATRVVFHFDDRPPVGGEIGTFHAPDTRYPFVLFLSQAETERVFHEHLTVQGVRVERGVELLEFTLVNGFVDCLLRDGSGRATRVRAKYLVGCDGAHSTVREGTGIPFEGGTYQQRFVLGDVEADGPLERDAINGFVAGAGVAVFFPLGSPRTWHVIAFDTGGARRAVASEESSTKNAELPDLQVLVDRATGGTIRLRDPAWITRFRLHHRQTRRYRSGRVFLAGDAAHIHSPAGAQGMNTGIQDAWNLGWKLGFVLRGWAYEALLDSYEEERWPVGHRLLRTTDRYFGLLTRSVSGGAIATSLRRAILPWALPRILRSERLRGYVFGFVSELRIRYRRSSAVTEGRPELTWGPRAGDRLPDAIVTRDGRETHLQGELLGPRLTLLLCGDTDIWDAAVSDLKARFDPLLGIARLTTRADIPGALFDLTGEAFERLGVTDVAQYLVRPDGHVAYRCAGADVSGLRGYLERWFRANDRRSAGRAPENI